MANDAKYLNYGMENNTKYGGKSRKTTVVSHTNKWGKLYSGRCALPHKSPISPWMVMFSDVLR